MLQTDVPDQYFCVNCDTFYFYGFKVEQKYKYNSIYLHLYSHFLILHMLNFPFQQMTRGETPSHEIASQGTANVNVNKPVSLNQMVSLMHLAAALIQSDLHCTFSLGFTPRIWVFATTLILLFNLQECL